MLKKIAYKLYSLIPGLIKREGIDAPVHKIELAKPEQDGTTSLDNLKKHYFGLGRKLPLTSASAIEIDKWKSFDTYLTTIKKANYKSSYYPFNRSKKKGFYSKEFRYHNFIPDIVGVNHSMEKRQGKTMSAGYKRSVEEMGEIPHEELPLNEKSNPKRYQTMYGVFQQLEGHQQGELTTNEQLVGYINFRRDGDVCIYSQILGHGNFLKEGIMYNLHYHIAEKVFDQNEFTSGIKYIMYGGHFQGNEGLRKWKEKLLLEPVNFKLK